jgi:hypothetical protein
MTFTPILWSTLRAANGDEQALRKATAQATADQLTLLYQRIDDAADELYAQPGFTAHADRGAANALARWAVTQGKSTWSKAMKDPTTLPRRPPAGAWDAMTVLEDVYRTRFGGDIPDVEPAPAGAYVYDPAWEAALWKVVDALAAGVPIDEAVGGFTRAELVKLAAAHAEVAERLRTHAEKQFGADPSGMDWSHWASWLPLEGKEMHDAVFSDPAKVPRKVPTDAPLFSDLLDEVYQQRYGAQIETG